MPAKKIEVKHTPWTPHTDGKKWWVQTPAPFRRVIADGLTEDCARLLATAPDLLSSLKNTIEAFRDCIGHAAFAEFESGNTSVKAARAAIAKADGR